MSPALHIVRTHAFSFGPPSSLIPFIVLNTVFPSSTKTIKFFRKILNIFSTNARGSLQIYKYKI